MHSEVEVEQHAPASDQFDISSQQSVFPPPIDQTIDNIFDGVNGESIPLPLPDLADAEEMNRAGTTTIQIANESVTAVQKISFYDANNPMRKINGFFLNFDATDASGAKIYTRNSIVPALSWSVCRGRSHVARAERRARFCHLSGSPVGSAAWLAARSSTRE